MLIRRVSVLCRGLIIQPILASLPSAQNVYDIDIIMTLPKNDNANSLPKWADNRSNRNGHGIKIWVHEWQTMDKNMKSITESTWTSIDRKIGAWNNSNNHSNFDKAHGKKTTKTRTNKQTNKKKQHKKQTKDRKQTKKQTSKQSLPLPRTTTTN